MKKSTEKYKLVSVRFSPTDLEKLEVEAARLRIALASLIRMKVVLEEEKSNKQ